MKSEVRLWDLQAVLEVMDSWVAGMRVGWGSKGVHSDVLSLVEHSCSSSYHSFYLNPYPVYKYCFILVQNEVYSFIS